MLKQMESELPSMMHLTISMYNTLHFYWYLSTHVLIADGQFLLLINVPIQHRAHQLQIYEIFSLPVQHSNLSTQHKVNHKCMMRQRQLPSQICSIEPVSMPMDRFAG